MGSHEITIWIDERWYDALSKQLKDETLEDHMGDVLDEMCGQLPESVQERISREIWVKISSLVRQCVFQRFLSDNNLKISCAEFQYLLSFLWPCVL